MARIPETYRSLRLNDFHTSLYTNQNDAKRIYDAIKGFWDNFMYYKAEGEGLYLFSRTKGSGKTMAAICLVNEIMEKYEIRTHFTTSTDIINEIRRTWDEKGLSESKLIDKLIMVPILVIDDFGTERIADWVNERYFQIVNRRYNENRMTIYTSNYPLEELGYDERITERVLDRTTAIQFPEDNIRRKLKEEKIIKRQKGQGI